MRRLQVGPLSISVAANNFKDYNGGVFTGEATVIVVKRIGHNHKSVQAATTRATCS